MGDGEPTVVFAHGIPASSYLWRNVLPIVGDRATAVAFDLPGYGESSLPPGGDYSYEALYAPMERWLDARPEGRFTLVVNDLGSVLGIDYAARHPERIAGLVLVEAVFMPAREWHAQLTGLQATMFTMMRADWFADAMIVSRPRLQSMIWGMGALRELSDAEHAVYLAPYEDVERRRVVRHGPSPATFPKRGVSRDPDDFAAVMDRNAAWLASADLPVLLLTGEPGFIVQPPAIRYARANFENLTVVDVGAGKHFLPEDQPTAVGRAIRDWLPTLDRDGRSASR